MIALALVFLLPLLQSCSTTVSEDAKADASKTSLSNSRYSWFKTDPRYANLANGPLASDIASSLSNAALKQAIEAEYDALENRKSGDPAHWQYSDKQSGKVVSYPPYQVGSSSCRRYIHAVSINGDTLQAAGTACRDKNGIWTPLT